MKTPPNKRVLSRRLDSLMTKLGQDRSRVLQEGGPEALHDFRVTLRRLRTCLRLLENLYPPRKLKPILVFLKRIASDTNALRDQEVLCATWHSLPPAPNPSKDWQQWLAAQEAIQAAQRKEMKVLLTSPDFARKFSTFKRTLALSDNRGDLTLIADAAFKKERRKLIKILKTNQGQKAGSPLLHKLRVQAKRVRYSLDEFDFLISRQGRKLAAQCKRVQDTLGEWRDLDQATEVLSQVGPDRFKEGRLWLQELRDRKDLTWKKYLQTLHPLQKALK